MSYLLYLRSFVSVYRHSSISRAASALSLTQPAVSRHVKLLEGRLGATLFTRLPRGLAPTPAAVELERQAGPHLDALEGMLDARGAGGALAGVAHVGATSGFIALLLPPLAGLHRRGLRVDLRAMPPPALLSALAERVIDVAVTPARIPHKGVEYQLLHECPQRLVCAPQWSGRLPKSAAPRGLPLIDQQGPAAPLTPYWKQVYARDPEAPALVLPTIRPRWTRPAPAPDWQWRPNACAATPCGPGSWSPRRRPGVRRLSPCTPRAPRDRCPSARATWND